MPGPGVILPDSGQILPSPIEPYGGITASRTGMVETTCMPPRRYPALAGCVRADQSHPPSSVRANPSSWASLAPFDVIERKTEPTKTPSVPLAATA